MVRTFDVASAALWTAMVMAFCAGLLMAAMRPEPRAIYTSDTGLCDSGC